MVYFPHLFYTFSLFICTFFSLFFFISHLEINKSLFLPYVCKIWIHVFYSYTFKCTGLAVWYFYIYLFYLSSCCLFAHFLYLISLLGSIMILSYLIYYLIYIIFICIYVCMCCMLLTLYSLEHTNRSFRLNKVLSCLKWNSQTVNDFNPSTPLIHFIQTTAADTEWTFKHNPAQRFSWQWHVK